MDSAAYHYQTVSEDAWSMRIDATIIQREQQRDFYNTELTLDLIPT